MNQTARQRHTGVMLVGLFFAATAVIIIAAFVVISRSGLEAGSAAMLRVCLEAALLISLAGLIALIRWWRRQTRLYQKLYELERTYHELNVRYETVFQNANDIIMIADRNMKIVAANERALATYGYTRDEMIGMPVALLRPSATRGDIERQFAAAKAEDGFRFETLAMKKDGTVFPIQSSVRAITIGEETFYIGILQDITERRRAEKALEEARREWENIFQAIGNPAFILDPDNGIVSANRAIQQALGMTEEQIKGKKCYEVLHRSDHPPAQCPLGKMIASNQTESSEMEVETLGGTYLVTCTPMFDASGKLTKAIHIAADITRLKKALTDVEEIRKRFSALVTSAQDAIIITDDHGIILFCNPSAERMLGFSPGELQGKSCEIYMPKDVGEQYRTVLARFHETGKSEFSGKTLTSKCLRKDGSIFSVEFSMCSWQEQEKTFFASFVRDITDRKTKEQQIQQQLTELRQWQKLTIGREERIRELKQEVNELLEKLGLPPQYPNAGEKTNASP